MTSYNHQTIPNTFELSPSEQEGILSGERAMSTDTAQENARKGVAEALDSSTIFIPDPEMWGDTSSPITEELSSLSTEPEEPIIPSVTDPAILFAIDEAAFEASLAQDREPEPVKTVSRGGMPEINWLFDEKPVDSRRTEGSTGDEKEDTLPPNASVEDLLRDASKKGLLQEVIFPEVAPLYTVSESVEPEKPWVSPDPFEQENPKSALEGKHGYYITQFRKIFEGAESDTTKELFYRYTKICLYVLDSFHIGDSGNQKDRIMLTLYGELRNDPEMTGKYEQFIGELKIKKNGGILPKKIYPSLNDNEKQELKKRYTFYHKQYEALKGQFENEETEQQRSMLIEQIDTAEQEFDYTFSAKRTETKIREEKENIVNNQVKRIIETIARPLYQKEMQKKVFSKQEIASIWKNTITPRIREKIGELTKMIVNATMDEIREKAELIKAVSSEIEREEMEYGILVSITERLVQEYGLSSIVQGLFDTGMAGEIQRKEKHAKRLETETNVTVLVHR